MLKIKDNVDLKELEKYGFEKGLKHGFDSPIATVYITLSRKVIIVSPNNCWWDKEYYYNYQSDTDIIYNLIKDGLVEKVE